MPSISKYTQNPLVKIVLLPLIAIVISVVAIFGVLFKINMQDSVTNTPSVQTISLAGKSSQSSLIVEIADTPDTQTQGLMYRTEMAADHGMLFVFDQVAHQTFWMQHTLISLDIIFLDSNMRVVNLYQHTKVNQTAEVYNSVEPVKYALEANAGWSNRVGLQIGDQLMLK